MEKTHRKRKVSSDAKPKIGQSTATQRYSGDMENPDENPKYKNAADDIKKDIARIEKITEKEKAAAKANQEREAGREAAAKQAEQDAGSLEQPVNPDTPKKRQVVPLIVSILLILILIGAALVKFGVFSKPAIPTTGSSLQTGTSMVGGNVTNTAVSPTVTWFPIAVNTVLPITASGTAKVNLNCRTGPGTIYPELNIVPKGTIVNVTGKSKDGLWLEIQPCGKGSGWVLATLLDVTGNLSAMPILVSPPTPIAVPPTDTSEPFNCTTAYGSSLASCTADPRCNYISKTCVNK